MAIIDGMEGVRAALDAAQREARRVEDLLMREAQPRQANGKQAKKSIVKPTPEQRRHARYELTEICDRSPTGRAIVIGKAYMRVPWFETMYARRISAMDKTDLLCLRYYRRAHEAANRSEVKSCLNRDDAIRGTGSFAPATVAGSWELTMCEEAIGSVLDIMRAIVIEDQPFAAVAMQRFGSREEVTWKDGVRKVRLVPMRKHVVIIEEEFVVGLSRLRAHAELYVKIERGTRP